MIMDKTRLRQSTSLSKLERCIPLLPGGGEGVVWILDIAYIQINVKRKVMKYLWNEFYIYRIKFPIDLELSEIVFYI